MDFKRLSPIDFAGLILALALLLCLVDMPYGYYVFVRFCTMVVMGCFAYKFWNEEKKTLSVVAGSIALLFQPFFKIVLGREMWNIVDVVLAITLLAYVILHQKNEI